MVVVVSRIVQVESGWRRVSLVAVKFMSTYIFIYQSSTCDPHQTTSYSIRQKESLRRIHSELNILNGR